jgi:hypothetical protein
MKTMKTVKMRLSSELLAEVDGLAARLRRARPGRSLSRAKLIRVLLSREIRRTEYGGKESFEELICCLFPPPPRRPS